jgi:hypothetical protein
MSLLRITAALVTIALTFVGCSSNQPSDANATGTPNQPTAAAPAASPAGSAALAPKTASNSPAAAPAPAVERAAPAAPPKVTVPAGTDLTVIMIDSVSSGKNQAGDEFMASLATPLVVNGKTVADKGTKVRGRVIDAEGSGRVKGLANIRLALTGIVDGAKTIPIVTKPFVAEAESTKGRDAAVAGGAAGVGAAIGAIAGGKKGAGIGAIVGGAGGTGAVLATKGKEVEFGSESKVKFTLDKDAELPVIGKKNS